MVQYLQLCRSNVVESILYGKDQTVEMLGHLRGQLQILDDIIELPDQLKKWKVPEVPKQKA